MTFSIRAFLLTLGLFCACASAQTYTNPIVPRGGDPWAVQWGGQYFYTSTTGGDVRIGRSPWLQSVNSDPQVVWDPPSGTAYSSEIWAPELHRLNDKWYIYVAADNGSDSNHRMYALEGTSSDPQGSYVLKGQISIPSNRWAIDGTVMEYGGKDYLIWSGRTYSDAFSNQSLYIAEMSNPWTLTGTRTQISNPTYSWETYGHPVNEGPEILQHGSDVFLTYSASAFETPNYAIGALKLTGTDPMLASSWSKYSQPLFQQGNGVEGTGHASFVKSPDGTQDWIVYHARTASTAPRDVRIQQFTWESDGKPVFGSPIPTGQPTPIPSGVPLVTFVPNESFERGGTGWLDDFHVSGNAGAVDNDGSRFTQIANGDGPRIGYLSADQGSEIHQDAGPIHAGTYTLSVGLAISDDELGAAAANPASFLLELKGVGLFPGGSANEADQNLLGSLRIDSQELNDRSFTYFELPVTIPDGPEVGNWLRVALSATDSPGSGAIPWEVKLDNLTLSYSGPDAAIVPEPGSAAGLFCAGLMLVARRRSRIRTPVHLRD
jgi:GH43 family beta-xylosidase